MPSTSIGARSLPSRLISHLSDKGGLVIDPFLGSGVAAIEAERWIIGIDINPAAARLTRMLVRHPSKQGVDNSLSAIKKFAKEPINATYRMETGEIATHYLWKGETLQQVWRTNGGVRKRVENAPSVHDSWLARNYSGYKPSRLRSPKFFTNSRINAKASDDLTSLFTGRALHNIEFLMEAIANLPVLDREPMLLSLTASIGQMSSMVFAITGRGKARSKKGAFRVVECVS